MEINSTLSELETLLYGYNYAVFLRNYQLPFISGKTVQNYIVQALPNIEIGGTQPISGQEVLVKIEQSLTYLGDKSSGPNLTALGSPRFLELLGIIMVHVQTKVADATTILSFWIKEGHPAYPVFWDFAFIFIGTQYVELFIGSSSD